MKIIVFLAAVLISGALAVSGLALKERFDQGAKTRTAICRSENTLRKILHDEHVKKLNNSIKFLRTHPNGIDGIPRSLILQSIQDEREIVAQTAPKICM